MHPRSSATSFPPYQDSIVAKCGGRIGEGKRKKIRLRINEVKRDITMGNG